MLRDAAPWRVEDARVRGSRRGSLPGQRRKLSWHRVHVWLLDRAKNQPPAVGNNRRPRSIVSGLLFTMNAATPTCRASARSADILIRGGIGDGAAPCFLLSFTAKYRE